MTNIERLFATGSIQEMQQSNFGRPLLKRVALIIAVGLFGAFVFMVASSPVWSKEILPGPIPADVVRVIDGDTIIVRAKIWLGQTVETPVRVGGIDTPEMKTTCEQERIDAVKAKNYVEDFLSGRAILTNIKYGKFAGRVVAQVQNLSGERLADALIGKGLARPYSGEKRESWCEGR